MSHLEHAKTQDKTKTQPTDAAGWAARAAGDYGHHPHAYQRDIAAANEYVHKHGFPTVEIHGVQGKDLVGKDKKSGHTFFIGGNHPDGEKVWSMASAKPVETASGHKASVSADGSGKYVVNSNDKTGHDVAKGILKDRYKANGVDREPTENEIANFGRELGNLNGKNWDRKLRDGKELKVGSTAFGEGDPHKTILHDGITRHPGEAIRHPIDAAKQALGFKDAAAAADGQDAKPAKAAHAPGLNDDGQFVRNEETSSAAKTKTKKGGEQTTEQKKGEVQDSWLERNLGSGGVVSSAVSAAKGWLGHGTEYHATETSDKKGLKEGRSYYSGAGTDLTVNKPDGSQVDLHNVYRTKTVRDAKGNFQTEYTTNGGTYHATYTADGKTLSFDRVGN